MRYDKHGRRKSAQKQQQAKPTAQEGDVGALKEVTSDLLSQLALQRKRADNWRDAAKHHEYELGLHRDELHRVVKVAQRLHLVYFTLGLAAGGLVMGVIRPALAQYIG